MRASLLTFVFIVLATAAQAQTPESRGTVSAIGGFAKTLDDEGSLGRGWLAGAAIDRVIFGSTRGELSFEVATHDRGTGFFLSEGTTYIGGLSIVHRFASGAAQPYILGGLTLGHHSGTNVFNGQAVPLNSTDGGFRVGAGIAFRAGQRLEIIPEFRLNTFSIDNDSNPATLPSFGVRVGWRM
jgi:hypothetical protein